MPRRDQIGAFNQLRKEGIFEHNKKEMRGGNPTYMWERGNEFSDELVMCTGCKGCYSRKYKARHQIHCGKDTGQIMIPVLPLKSLEQLTAFKDDFKAVINKMVIDDISAMAKSDPLILVVGSRIFNGQKCKTEKKQEVEKRVRTVMCQLSRLYLKFKESVVYTMDSSDMFNKDNLAYLRFAIDGLCEEDDRMKCGLKVQLQNTIKQSAKIAEAHYWVEGLDALAARVSTFLKVFALVEEEIFHGALYKLKQKINNVTRKPANLLNDEVIEKLTRYLKAFT